MVYTVCGWIGMILFIVNYALVANKKIEASGKLFNAVQVIAAVAVAYSLLPAKAWSTIALELFVMMIGLIAIFKKKEEKIAAQ